MDDDDRQRKHRQELVSLGRAFREARYLSGLSEREFADAVRGISLDGIRKIEAGERPSFNYEQIIRLAHALGAEPSAILGRAESLERRVMARKKDAPGLDGLGDRKMAAEAPKTAYLSRSEPFAPICSWLESGRGWATP